MENRLITLAFSHYNEKARWALERFSVPHREERYLPFFCSAAVAVATRGRGGEADRTSSRFSTPVLLLGDGRVLSDSTDIVRYAAHHDQAFSSGDGVSELVDHYGDRLGPYTRLLAYWHMVRLPGLIERTATDNVSRRQARIFLRLLPLVRSNLKKSLGLSEASRDRALARVRKELDATAARLEGREHLCGDRFTAADLTFASLMSPILCVQPDEGHGAVLPPLESLDREARGFVEEMRSHSAGQFALRMYSEERRRAAR
ncbi:MAG: glutathione binding-like protein [Myxococcota bacterium]